MFKIGVLFSFLKISLLQLINNDEQLIEIKIKLDKSTNGWLVCMYFIKPFFVLKESNLEEFEVSKS